ncbi:MAG: hypothetical protein IJ456_07560 [Bacteroides sp.]|nr:hypothetical protein [Bacteroides sp.]
MKTLYLFNPENDMALAYGGAYYMPPANVRRMASDLAVLPAWYAMPQGEVWLPDTRQARWLDEECSLRLPVVGGTSPDAIYNKVMPWGWNASLVRRLKEQGIPADVCPSDREMERIRTLSARGTAVEVLRRMAIPHTLGQSWEVRTMEELTLPPPFLLKAPWSGSGRGIQKVESIVEAPLQGWINHILKTQGYVVAEPFYQKVADFAMEFRMGRAGAEFMGYSFFETDTRGIYKENLLATDAEIERRLSAYVPIEVLGAVRTRLLEELPRALNGYEGYWGVDMMICSVPEGYAVHPCVEINLRMNMGIVARTVYDRYICSGAVGRYVIEYYPRPGEALRMHTSLQQEYPLVVERNKIRQGYLSLTPVFEDTAYQAYVVIGND